MRQVIIDTETTGLTVEEGHRIIEIGCVELVNRRLTENHFHHYVNPDCDIDQGALEVHGITREFLADKPTFGEVAHAFFEFIKEAQLIAHNALFDITFINHELKYCQFKVQDITEYCQVIDTLSLARRLHPGQRNTLDALCKRYHLDHFNRKWHGALLDAEILAQVYLAMTSGQGSLFTDASDQTVLQKKKFKKAHTSAYSPRVISAQPEELAEHERFLEKLKDKH